MRAQGGMQDGGATLGEWLSAGARERRTFALLVTTDEGMGRIYVNLGEVVHAVFGHLVGEGAVQAMLAAPGVEFEAVLEPRRPSTPPPFPKTLALLPAASERRSSPPPLSVAVSRPRSTPPSQRLPILAHSTPAPPVAVEIRRHKALPFAALAGVLVLGALTGFALNTLGDDVLGAPTPARLPAPPGSASPAASATVPTVVLRLLIGADGRPSAARVAGSNLDPKLFEQAALAAAKRLEFRPSLRAGVPVEAELEWPVSFRPDAMPEAAPASSTSAAPSSSPPRR